MIILNLNRLPHWTETETAYLGKLITHIFQVTDRDLDPRNGIWNDLIGLVILSAYSSIYSKWNYKTENKMHTDI